MPRTQEVATGRREQLQAAARTVAERRTALQLALQQRNRIIVECVDVEGISQRTVMRDAGLRSLGALTKVLAQPEDDDE